MQSDMDENMIVDEITAIEKTPLTKINMQLIRKCMNLRKNDISDENDEAEQLLLKTVLRLDWQNIGKIENLDIFSHIRELYLQHNAIQRIENLDFHSNLEFLALSHNQISTLENLKHLTKLRFLDLSYNSIADLNLDELPPSLMVLRLAGNPLTDTSPDYHLELFNAFPRLSKCDHFSRDGLNRAESPTNHERAIQDQKSFDTSDSRDDIKKQKLLMSSRHEDKMKELNETLDMEKNQIVERSMKRMRERRKKLQEQTKNYLDEATSHVQELHAEHATWRKKQLESSGSATTS